MCATTCSYVWHDYRIPVPWLLPTCAMAPSHVCHDSFVCVPWLVHMCAMTHSSLVRHDSPIHKINIWLLPNSRSTVYTGDPAKMSFQSVFPAISRIADQSDGPVSLFCPFHQSVLCVCVFVPCYFLAEWLFCVLCVVCCVLCVVCLFCVLCVVCCVLRVVCCVLCVVCCVLCVVFLRSCQEYTILYYWQ